jgi:serine/threonine-protein kinase
LLQRKPEDRYPSAAALEADLRAGLASLGAPYGAAEALEEGRNSRDGASMNRRVAGPTNENELPPAMMEEEDIITASGGLNYSHRPRSFAAPCKPCFGVLP